MEILRKVEAALQETMKLMAENQHNEGAGMLMAANTTKVNTLRFIKSEFIRTNEKIYHTNLEYKLTDDEETKVLLKMAEDHRTNIEAYEKAGNETMRNKETSELKYIEELTPSQPTEEEMTEYINTLIDGILSKMDSDYQLSMKSMGAIMPKAKEKYPNINGNLVKQVLASRMK
jgi:uncharacterized protein YqeY